MLLLQLKSLSTHREELRHLPTVATTWPKLIFHSDHCVSSKYNKDGEEHTYKGCGSDLKKTLQIIGVTKETSSYSECDEDLCNGAESVSRSSLCTTLVGSVVLVLCVLFWKLYKNFLIILFQKWIHFVLYM